MPPIATIGVRLWPWDVTTSILSKTICDEDSDVPQAGDDIIGLGHRTDVDLQSAIVLSSTNETSPSITFYTGIDDFNLTGKDVSPSVLTNPPGMPT